MSQAFHIAIIGSGPAGLSAAARAAFYDREQRRSQPSYILLESYDRPAKTIQQYQKGKFVMDEPGFLNLRSDCGFSAGSREQVLARWQSDIDSGAINIRYGAKVAGISGQRGNFTLSLESGENIRAQFVILAIGLEGNPRRMGVPGDDAPIVQYTLEDPDAFDGEHIVVVGAGDSAIENALALARKNTVTIINRRDEFSRAKEGNLNAVLKAINNPKVKLNCYYRTTVKELNPPATTAKSRPPYQLVVNTPEGDIDLPCNRIIARLGAVPPRQFVQGCGIEFSSEAADAAPVLSAQYESSVPGLYVVGSLAGYPLIKQAMNQGYDVVEYILGHQIKPADHPLLEFQFGLLPYRREPEDILALFQGRIPMFRELNALAFRELIIESHVWVALEEGLAYQEAAAVEAKIKARAQENAKQNKPVPRTAKLIRAGETIYRAGDYTNTFFTIVEGEVTLVPEQGSGPSTVLKRGEFFGENSLLSGRPRVFTAVAGRDCILVETPRRTMLKLMNGNERVREGIDWIFIVRALQKHFAPNVDPKALRSVAEACVLKTFKAGETLFTEGEQGDCLYLIRRGSVTLSRHVEGTQVVVTRLQSDQLVGEMALMGDAVRRETAQASVLTETIAIYRESFLALLNLDSSSIEGLQRQASARAVDLATMQVQRESGQVMAFLMAQGLGESTNAMVIDENLCIGCDNCEKACAETHNGLSRLQRAQGASYNNVHIPISCRHCEHPYCMKDCPPNAIHRAPSGEVFIDNTCIGCGNCQSNCPYDAIQLAYDAPPKPSLWRWLLFGSGSGPGQEPNYKPTQAALDKGKKAVKCDACVNQAQGPACVRACPTGAAARVSPLEFIELVEKR